MFLLHFSSSVIFTVWSNMVLIIFQCSFIPQSVSMCTFGYLSIAATAMCERDQFSPRERSGHGYWVVLNRDGPCCSCRHGAFSTTQAQSLLYPRSGFSLCMRSLFLKPTGFTAAPTAVLSLWMASRACAPGAAVGLGLVIICWSHM